MNLQMRLTPEVIEIIVKLCLVFPDSKKVYAWLTTKNMNLGNLSPLYLINCGRANKVLEFINSAKEQR